MIPSIEQIRSIQEVMVSYLWEVQFVKGSAEIEPPTDLNVRCISSTAPKKTNTPINIGIRGRKVMVPGTTEENGNSIQLQFLETVDATMLKFIKEWREKVQATDSGVHAPVSSVKMNVILYHLNRQGQPIWKYELRGCWLSDYDIGELVGEGGDAIKPSITLTFDYFVDEAV